MFFLGLFLVLSFIDGIVLHLVRYRLPENPDSRFEHLTHTARAFLFIPIVYMLFYLNVSGPTLWFLSGLVLFDLCIESIDILEERRSRLRLGGLASGEYLIHIVETTFRIAAVTLAYAVKPIEAWSGAIELPPYPESVRSAAFIVIVGSIGVALLHVVLIFKPFFMTTLLGSFGRKK